MLSDEELDELHNFVKEHFPMQYQRIKRIWADDPNARRRIAARLWPRISQLIDVYRRNPELGELMIQDHQLEEDVRRKAHAYRDANSDPDHTPQPDTYDDGYPKCHPQRHADSVAKPSSNCDTITRPTDQRSWWHWATCPRWSDGCRRGRSGRFRPLEGETTLADAAVTALFVR